MKLNSYLRTYWTTKGALKVKPYRKYGKKILYSALCNTAHELISTRETLVIQRGANVISAAVLAMERKKFQVRRKIEYFQKSESRNTNSNAKVLRKLPELASPPANFKVPRMREFKMFGKSLIAGGPEKLETKH
eukprot:IDg2568t1